VGKEHLMCFFPPKKAQNERWEVVKGFWQKRNVFLSVPLRSVPLFLEVPAKTEHSSFFFEPRRFLWISGNFGYSCRNAQLHNLVAIIHAVEQSKEYLKRT
jgi:hypothetical protein